jgi:hypothetical protein
VLDHDRERDRVSLDAEPGQPESVRVTGARKLGGAIQDADVRLSSGECRETERESERQKNGFAHGSPLPFGEHSITQPDGGRRIQETFIPWNEKHRRRSPGPAAGVIENGAE